MTDNDPTQPQEEPAGPAGGAPPPTDPGDPSAPGAEPPTEPIEAPHDSGRPRKLTRSRDDRMIGGVAGGLGRYFHVDPIIFRIVAVALLFVGGLSIVVYIAALLFVPVEGGRPIDGRRVLVRIGVAVGAVALAAILLFAGAWATAIGGGALIAGLVIGLGAVLVGGALSGRRRARWLAVPALLLAIPLGIVSAADFDLDGGYGEREYRPRSIGELRGEYELGAGRMELDLRRLRLPAGRRPLNLDVGLGEVVLVVPEDVCVATDARVGAGYVRVLDRENEGLDVDWQDHPAPRQSVPRLTVTAEVGMGSLEIVHDPRDAHSYDHEGIDHDGGDVVGGGSDACRGEAAGARRGADAGA